MDSRRKHTNETSKGNVWPSLTLALVLQEAGDADRATETATAEAEKCTIKKATLYGAFPNKNEIKKKKTKKNYKRIDKEKHYSSNSKQDDHGNRWHLLFLFLHIHKSRQCFSASASASVFTSP